MATKHSSRSTIQWKKKIFSRQPAHTLTLQQHSMADCLPSLPSSQLIGAIFKYYYYYYYTPSDRLLLLLASGKKRKCTTFASWQAQSIGDWHAVEKEQKRLLLLHSTQNAAKWWWWNWHQKRRCDVMRTFTQKCSEGRQAVSIQPAAYWSEWNRETREMLLMPKAVRERLSESTMQAVANFEKQ